MRTTSRPLSSQSARRLRLALVARSARLISNARRLARRGQPRLGVLLGQSGMNAAHCYAASRSRHRHFCSRCCTISPKPLEVSSSARCSRHELSAETPASLSSSPAGRLTLARPHLTCDEIPRARLRLSGLDPLSGSGRAFRPGGSSGGRRTPDLFTRSPGLASGVVAHASARSSTCAALMLDESSSMVDRIRPVRWAEVGLAGRHATSDSPFRRFRRRRGPLSATCELWTRLWLLLPPTKAIIRPTERHKNADPSSALAS